ncbi:hypothetical protein Pelo_16359 [Pelomyxa schiedti]|nr:hypothetical protein Pelo_16359 [Pelomyxa schiedti]
MKNLDKEGDAFVRVLLVVHCSFHLPSFPPLFLFTFWKFPTHGIFGCRQQGFFFYCYFSCHGGTIALGFGLSQPSIPQMVLLSCFEINDPTSAVLPGFCWSSFCFCPSVAIALGVANDPVAASQVPLAVELCVWLFSGLRACALHMIGNDALFTPQCLATARRKRLNAWFLFPALWLYV